MAATDYPTLITKIRTDGDDPATGQLLPMDTPDGRRDGANTLFKVHATNLVSGVVNTQQCGPWLTYGTGTVRSLTGFTIQDAVNGYITMGSAPDASTTFPFFFDVRFLWFQDGDYQTWIDEATEELGYQKGVATPEGLYPALISLVLWRYYNRRSTQWAIRYAASGGGASDKVDNVSKQLQSQAKEARKTAIDQVKFYMNAQGQRDRPSSYTNTLGIDPYSPKR